MTPVWEPVSFFQRFNITPVRARYAHALFGRAGIFLPVLHMLTDFFLSFPVEKIMREYVHANLDHYQ